MKGSDSFIAEPQYRRFQRRILAWATLWIAAFIVLGWVMGRVEAAIGGWGKPLSWILLIVTVSFMPPFTWIRLACGRYSTFPARYAKAMKARKARLSGRTSGEAVRDWSLFTKVLVIGFFTLPLGLAVLMMGSGTGAIHWGIAALAACGLILPGAVIYLWFFQPRPPAPPDLLRQAMRALVEERITALRGLDRAAIEALPRAKREDVATPHGKVVLTSYHDALRDGAHRVVVKVARMPWIGWNFSMEMDAFVLGADGEAREFTEEETWPFV